MTNSNDGMQMEPPGPGFSSSNAVAAPTLIPPSMPAQANLPVGFALSDVQSALVKWFDPTKNYGFLIIKDGPLQGDEIFVHGIDVVGQPIRDNDSVMCQIQSAPNVKRRCVNVTGGTGTHGDMTRPPKNNSAVLAAAQHAAASGELDENERIILGNKLPGGTKRKDSRCGYRSLGDLRKRALKRMRNDSRSDSRSKSRHNKKKSDRDRRSKDSRSRSRRGRDRDRRR